MNHTRRFNIATIILLFSVFGIARSQTAVELPMKFRGSMPAVEVMVNGKGIGREMMLWAIGCAKEKGCHSMLLTSHKTRERAHAFYEELGFEKSHVGMKLNLK